MANARGDVSLTACEIQESKVETGSSEVTESLEKFDITKTSMSKPELRIVLLGKTGAGKSASGNTILGREVFKEDSSCDSVTTVCQTAHTEVNGWAIKLIDTPGLFDTKMNANELKSKIEKCVEFSLPGPHVFLLVIRLGVRFTEEEQNAVKWIQENFGKRAADFTIVLFTHVDQLRKSIEKTLNENLNILIGSCGGGYHAFNNLERRDQTQVKELLEKIDAMVERNGGEYYTNKMYQEAQEKIRKEEERKIQEEKKKKEEYDRQIREEEIKRRKEAEIQAGEERKKRVEAERELEVEKDRRQKAEAVIAIGGVVIGATGGAVGGALYDGQAGALVGGVAGVIAGGGSAVVINEVINSGQRDTELSHWREEAEREASVEKDKRQKAEEVITIGEVVIGATAGAVGGALFEGETGALVGGVAGGSAVVINEVIKNSDTP